MTARNSLVSGLFLAIFAASSPALADPPAPSADALFQEGKKLLEQGRFAEACDRLSRSDTLDPTISTLGLLATCHEQQGRLATAYSEYRAAAKRGEGTGDARAEFAKQRAAALEAQLPKLMIRVAHPIAGIEIFRNLERVAPESLGAEVPVDPGAYEIVVRAPQRRDYRITVTAKEGKRVTVDVPELLFPSAAAPPALDAEKKVEPPKPAPAAEAKAPPAPVEGANNLRTAGLVVGGVGLVGLGVGAALGASALSKNLRSTTIHETCKTAASCDEGRALRSQAYAAATGSTIAIVVGAAAVVTGAVLILIPRKTGESRPTAGLQLAPLAGPGLGGAILDGSF